MKAIVELIKDEVQDKPFTYLRLPVAGFRTVESIFPNRFGKVE